MRLNRTSNWKVMTIWISRELHCSISSISIYYLPESDIRVISYDHLNFSSSSGVQFRASRYIMRLNRTFIWKVMTIWISWKLLLFNFERLDMLSTWIGHPIEKLLTFEFLESFRCSMSSVWIYYAPESDFRVKSYDRLNFSRAFVVQFPASRYVMCLNQTSEWKVMKTWNSWELSLFNLDRLDMWCAWIRHPIEILWPVEFLESFRWSILII